jgi:large conductance mechanosensitive channel
LEVIAMLKEFRDFALKGNVVDLAVAVILGAAFGAIVSSLVKDMIKPVVGMALGGVNFTDLFISLDGKQYPSLAIAQAAGAPTINYGLFINTIIDFIIVAFVLFLIIRQINQMKKAPAPAATTTKECPYCFTQIPIPATRCPHSRQNLAVVGSSAPHLPHVRPKRAPHSRQNFACGGFSC